MAHTLNLVYGSTTVALASGDYKIRKYVQRVPGDGETTVSETAVILITASSLANLQADIKAIEKAFEMARLRQDGKSILEVYVQFQGYGESTLYQCELLYGRVELPESALTGDWANTQLEVALIWERSYPWEGSTWLSVPLTNGNGTDLTTGINVYNCNDGSGTSPNKRNNYIDIDGVNDLTGNLPAPVKIQIEPTYAVSLDHIYIGMQSDILGLGLVQPYAEAAASDVDAFNYSLGAKLSDSSCSGGYYLSTGVRITAGGSIVITRSPSSETLNAYIGGFYKFIVRWYSTMVATSQQNLWIKFALTNNSDGTGIVVETGWVKASQAQLQVFGDLKIPPRNMSPRSGNIYTPYMCMYIKNTGPDDTAVYLDFVTWFPTQAYMEIGSSTSAITTGQAYVQSSGYERRLYKMYSVVGDPTGSSYMVDIYHGNGLWLMPGVNHRIHVLGMAGTASNITDRQKITMWYKPRRSTI